MKTLKQCKNCGGTDFYEKDRKCKVCVLARVKRYALANPEKVKAAHAAKYRKKATEINAKQAERRKLNQGHYRAKDAAYYEKNKEKLNEGARKYYQNNKVVAKERMKRWHSENPHANKTYGQSRRVRSAGEKLSVGIVDRLLILQKGKCACCRAPLGKDFHIDHIVPVALGGRNIDSNIQLLRKSCNLQKHARHPVDYMQSKGFLL